MLQPQRSSPRRLRYPPAAQGIPTSRKNMRLRKRIGFPRRPLLDRAAPESGSCWMAGSTTYLPHIQVRIGGCVKYPSRPKHTQYLPGISDGAPFPVRCNVQCASCIVRPLYSHTGSVEGKLTGTHVDSWSTQVSFASKKKSEDAYEDRIDLDRGVACVSRARCTNYPNEREITFSTPTHPTTERLPFSTPSHLMTDGRWTRDSSFTLRFYLSSSSGPPSGANQMTPIRRDILLIELPPRSHKINPTSVFNRVKDPPRGRVRLQYRALRT